MISAVYRCAAIGMSAVAMLLVPTRQAVADSVTLLPVKDATLFEQNQGSLADGSGQYLFAGRTGQPANRRALLAFDIAATVPTQATMTRVTLTLNMSRTIASARTATLHWVLADWGEGSSNAGGQEGAGVAASTGEATWLHTFHDTGQWSAAGGDFASSASSNQSVSNAGPYSWSSSAMIADVQSWLDDPAADFGWLIRGDESATRTAKRFDSREHPTVGNQPTLTIEFDTPDTTQADTNTAPVAQLDSIPQLQSYAGGQVPVDLVLQTLFSTRMGIR
jgi:hypothetical protein